MPRAPHYPALLLPLFVVACGHAGPDEDAGAPDSGSGSDGGAVGDGGDSCPAPNGLTWNGETRFAYGGNYAWRNWATDFGGAYGNPGISGNSAGYDSDLAAMKDAGVSVIRWWMFPTFPPNDSIPFGSDGAPSGIGGTLVADIHEALALADKHDVYLMLTLFSFDGFSDNPTPTLLNIVPSAALTQETMDNLVKPVAQAVESSPYKSRMLAWDLINEPEWALSGSDPYGDPGFGASTTTTVTFSQMETFLRTLATTLHANSGAPVTVGSAAIKWANAWKHIGLDFYSLHYYQWIYQWFPYETVTLASVGLTDKPVVMTEFPDDGIPSTADGLGPAMLPARTVEQLSQDWWNGGYAGALSWSFQDMGFPWSASNILPFHDDHPCQTAF